jgi:hypothetical protein
MSDGEFLLCIAQVGLTLAGFAGVIGVFRPSASIWSPQEVAGLRLILSHSFFASLLALIPFPLQRFMIDPRNASKASACFVAAFLILAVFTQQIEYNRLHAKGYPPRRPIVLFSILFINFLVGIFSITSIYSDFSQLAFEIGLLWILIAAGWQFWVFVDYFADSNESVLGVENEKNCKNDK